MDWNYIWAALFINFLLVRVVPKMVTKPTGFKPVDDVVLYLNTQDGFLLSSSLALAFVIYMTHYWMDSSSAGTAVKSPVV
jgi:hypothetical protein